MPRITCISLSVSKSLPLRELVARNDTEVRDQTLELFSACHGEDLRNLTVGDTFELCQAGYPERKLAYNNRTRLVFSRMNKKPGILITFRFDSSTFHVALRMQDHEDVEGVIYEASCHNAGDFDHCQAKFYLRPKMNLHRGTHIPHQLLVVKDRRTWRFANDNEYNIKHLIRALMEAHYVR